VCLRRHPDKVTYRHSCLLTKPDGGLQRLHTATMCLDTLLRLLFHVPTLASTIGHFQLLDRSCETAFRPTYDSPTLYPSSVPPGVKDIFVWLTETPAPSDFLFVVRYTNALTYLLSYLLTADKAAVDLLTLYGTYKINKHISFCPCDL